MDQFYRVLSSPRYQTYALKHLSWISLGGLLLNETTTLCSRGRSEANEVGATELSKDEK